MGQFPLLLLYKSKRRDENLKKGIAATVADLVRETVEREGCSLWDTEYVKEGADWHLRITIDKEGGVGIDDCERVHRAIDPLLDEADPIEGFYYLEVSSPGLERELKTDAHLAASVGETVELRLFAPRDGAKVYTGVLVESGGGEIVISVGEAELRFARSEVAKITTVYTDD